MTFDKWEMLGFLFGLFCDGVIIFLVVSGVRKCIKKIKDKKRQKVWKAAAEKAAAEEATEK